MTDHNNIAERLRDHAHDYEKWLAEAMDLGLVREAADALNAYPKLVEAIKEVRTIAAGYADAPCFTDLLGDELDEPCTCPPCGLRAVLRACALASTEEDR